MQELQVQNVFNSHPLHHFIYKILNKTESFSIKNFSTLADTNVIVVLTILLF